MVQLKKTILALFILLVFPVIASAEPYSEDYSYGENMSYGEFSGDIWQPNGSYETGVSGGINAKVSCSDIQVDFDIDAFAEKYQKVLSALIGNTKIIAINTGIRGTARLWAVQQCGGGLEEILMEYPEMAQKLLACIQEGMGDATKLKSGMAAGTASFGIIEVENNPGVFSKISGCITGELGDEYGDGFRRCIDRQTEDNVNTIRDVLNWAMKFDFQLNMEAKQKCILDEQLKQEDYVRAVKAYGPVMNADGSVPECTGDTCIQKKVAWSSSALTVKQDNWIKNRLLDYIDLSLQESSLPDEKKKIVYDYILNWFDLALSQANMWEIKNSCDRIIHTANSDETIRSTSYLKIPEQKELNRYYVEDPGAVTEAAAVLKQTCISYETYVEQRMFRTSAEKPIPAFESEVMRKTWEMSSTKMNADFSLKNLSYEAKKAGIEAKKRARDQERKRYLAEINKAKTAIEKKGSMK